MCPKCRTALKSYRETAPSAYAGAALATMSVMILGLFTCGAGLLLFPLAALPLCQTVTKHYCPACGWKS